jgi:hypothetical protein
MKKMKKLLLFSLLFTTTLFADKFNAILDIQRVAIPMKIHIEIPSNWTIGASSDASKYSDFLYTKKRSVYMRIGFTKLGNISTKERYEKEIVSDYEKHVVNDKTIYTKTGNGARYIDVRMMLSVGEEKLGLYIPMFPYIGFDKSSLESELNELVQILSTLNVTSLPGAETLKKVKEAKYTRIKKEIEHELSSAILIKDDGTLKDVHSFCRSLDIIPFKYSQDKKAPKWIKDYVSNAITQCKGKLYTGALNKYLNTKGKSSCPSLKIAFEDDFFIKSELRKSDATMMWNNLQEQYKKICK